MSIIQLPEIFNVLIIERGRVGDKVFTPRAPILLTKIFFKKILFMFLYLLKLIISPDKFIDVSLELERYVVKAVMPLSLIQFSINDVVQI